METLERFCENNSPNEHHIVQAGISDMNNDISSNRHYDWQFTIAGFFITNLTLSTVDANGQMILNKQYQ